MRLSLSEHEFIAMIAELNPNFVVSDYVKMSAPVNVHCNVCGKDFTRRGNRLKENPTCPHCSGTYARQNIMDEMVRKDIAKISPTIEIISEYKRMNEPVTCRCKIDGHIWNVTPSDLYRGRGCPECKKNTLRKLYQTDANEIMDMLIASNPDISFELVNYQNVMSKVNCTCLICGNKWTTTIHNIIYSKTGCPACQSSKGEKIIKQYLEKNGIKYEAQKKFEECRGTKRPLPFDFYLEDNNILIEFQGIEHYKPIPFFGGVKGFQTRQALDKIKKDYAVEHGYIFLEISYRDLKKGKIEEILSQNIRR